MKVDSVQEQVSKSQQGTPVANNRPSASSMAEAMGQPFHALQVVVLLRFPMCACESPAVPVRAFEFSFYLEVLWSQRLVDTCCVLRVF